MSKMKPMRCVKCNYKVVGACKMCGDPICSHHSDRDDDGGRVCFRCGVKYYIIWQQEQESEETQQKEYLEWLKEKVSKEQSTISKAT